MNKKEIIFWSVLISVCIIFTSVVVFYKPLTAPLKYDGFTVHTPGNLQEYTSQDEGCQVVKKAINRAINSSRYSLLNPSTTEEAVCDDDTVFRYKILRDYWVECFPATGKYEKLFFWVNADTTGKQTMLVFASKTEDTYNGGKLLLLYSTDTPTLLQSLKELPQAL